MQSHLSERSISTESALDLIGKEIRSLGISYKLETYGVNPQTIRCNLYDDSGNAIETGAGKGLSEQSKASAKFEALEHYLASRKTKIDLLKAGQKIEFLPLEELRKFNKLAEEKPIELMLEKQINGEMACQKFTSLDQSESIYYPLQLTIPEYISNPLEEDSFDYTIPGKYTSNSGSGIGVGFTEALIHSINETIERDAISIFLLKTFIKRSPDKIKIVNKTTIPARLYNLINTIELEFGTKITILDITSDFNVPTFYTHFTNSSRVKPATGMGTSLSKEYALERALLEALQVAHISSNIPNDHFVTLGEKTARSRMEKFPNYYDCLSHNIHKPINEGRTIEVSFNDVLHHDIGENLKDYLKLLDELVEARDYRIYTSVHYMSESNITALHTIIPGTEKFYLTQSGVFVLPSVRGRDVLVSNSPAPSHSRNLGRHIST